MIELVLNNCTGERYSTMRDMICEALVGNRAFRECGIVISNAYEQNNQLCIVLGDSEHNRHDLLLYGDIQSVNK